MHRFLRWVSIALITAAVAGCAGRAPDEAADARPVEDLYEEARTSLSNGSYTQAIDRFEQLVARYPFGTYAVQSQLMIIYAHYRAGQYESAIAAAERFQRMHPRNEHVAYTLYMSGVTRQAKGPSGMAAMLGVDETLRDPEPSRRAFSEFRELVEQYPDSEYADDARARMDEIRTELAAYELYVGRFYLEREAYIAAAKRAQTVTTRYPGTPAVPEAMRMLAEAYRGLGLTSLEDLVEAELERLHEPPALPLGEAASAPAP